jgi:hypothetical protein
MQPESSQSTGLTFQSFAMCGASARTTYQQSIASPAAFPVRTSAAPDSGQESLAPDQDCGPSSPESFANYDPVTCSWRTLQLSFIEELTGYSATWSRSGLMRNGTAYRLPPLVRRISGTGSTSWPTSVADGDRTKNYAQGGRSLGAAVRMLPTPRSRESGNWQRDNKGNKLRRLTLTGAAKLLPTPTSNRRSGLQSHGKNIITGALNPTWVEWLMGFPLGWTDLEG